MLFLITQVHSPENCPKDVPGGMKTLYNEEASGVSLKAIYATHAAHTITYIVEADKYESIAQFLEPGMKRATVTITPVGMGPIKG